MTCVAVLGCYRSGTSAIAGVLHHLGVFMGEKFDPPSANNTSGYWEDIDFKSYHTKFDAGELDDNPALMNEYVDLIKLREKEHKLWGLKDPLLCTNLFRFISNLKTDHKLIVCHRPVADIAKSLAIGLKEENLKRFEPLAQFYVDQMHQQLLNYRGQVLEMEHRNTLANPEFHVQRIANFVGLPVTQEALFHIVK